MKKSLLSLDVLCQRFFLFSLLLQFNYHFIVLPYSRRSVSFPSHQGREETSTTVLIKEEKKHHLQYSSRQRININYSINSNPRSTVIHRSHGNPIVSSWVIHFSRVQLTRVVSGKGRIGRRKSAKLRLFSRSELIALRSTLTALYQDCLSPGVA